MERFLQEQEALLQDTLKKIVAWRAQLADHDLSDERLKYIFPVAAGARKPAEIVRSLKAELADTQTHIEESLAAVQKARALLLS